MAVSTPNAGSAHFDDPDPPSVHPTAVAFRKLSLANGMPIIHNRDVCPLEVSIDSDAASMRFPGNLSQLCDSDSPLSCPTGSPEPSVKAIPETFLTPISSIENCRIYRRSPSAKDLSQALRVKVVTMCCIFAMAKPVKIHKLPQHARTSCSRLFT